jgi:hypothetical protein
VPDRFVESEGGVNVDVASVPTELVVPAALNTDMIDRDAGLTSLGGADANTVIRESIRRTVDSMPAERSAPVTGTKFGRAVKLLLQTRENMLGGRQSNLKEFSLSPGLTIG